MEPHAPATSAEQSPRPSPCPSKCAPILQRCSLGQVHVPATGWTTKHLPFHSPEESLHHRKTGRQSPHHAREESRNLVRCTRCIRSATSGKAQCRSRNQ